MPMCPACTEAGPNAAPRLGTSSRCQATPAPPAPCVDTKPTPGILTWSSAPVAVVPTTWIVAVPWNLATSPITSSEAGVTRPWTCICRTCTQGPNGNPPEQIGKHTSELQSPVHLVCRLLLE